MNRRSSLLLLAVLLAWSGRALANSSLLGCPLMIDDFTQGALPVANGPFEFTHVGLPTANCLGGTRHVRIDATPTHAAGMVPLGGGDIGYHMETHEEGTGQDVFESDFLLEYPMAQPVDLTAGGLNDRIEFDLLSVDHVQMLMMIYSTGGGAGVTIHFSHGVTTAYFSQYAPYVDLTQVTRIEMYFNENSFDQVSELTIERIRATGPGLKDILMNLPTLVQLYPPWLDPGPLLEQYYVDDEGVQQPTLGLSLSVERAQILAEDGGVLGDFPIAMRSSDSGLGDEPGIAAGYEFVEAAAGKNNHSDGSFELRLGIDGIGSYFVGSMEVSGIDPNPFRSTIAYIDFDFELLEPSGAPAGHQRMRLQLRVPEGAPYELRDVRVETLRANDLRLAFQLLDDGSLGKDEGQELFTLSFSGDFEPATPISTPAPLFVPEGLTLRAEPSVISARTLLRFSRPLRHDATLRVFDLAGRLIDTIALPVGSESMGWDGKDSRGRSVASGKYLLQLSDGPDRAVQKVVVVR